MIRVTRKQFIRFSVLPGFRPRLQELFFSGFGYIPFFIALVYQVVKLLPADHPYLNPANIGRFGLRNVIGEAAGHLKLTLKNTDQIVMFFAVLVGLALVFIQIVLLAVSLAFQPAFSAQYNIADFFITQQPLQDIALIMLDLVFGVPDLFFSCVNALATCQDSNGGGMLDYTGASIFAPLGWPFPIHHALHEMFRLYSTGLLVVAALITCYFITTILMETAQTGTAFGKRFNRLWAPIRIVVAFGLLIPIGYGLNSAQYIVLYAAKFGSAFATNGWVLFNETLTDTYLGETERLVSRPNVPEVGGLLQFLYTASTCAWLEWLQRGESVEGFLVRDPLSFPPNLLFVNFPGVNGWTSNNNPTGFRATYEEVLAFANGDQNLILRFGVEDRSKLNKGYIIPLCGEMVIPLSDARPPGEAEPGTEMMQRYYIHLVQELWNEIFTGQSYGENFPFYKACEHVTIPDKGCPAVSPQPDSNYASGLGNMYRVVVGGVVTNAVQMQVNSGTWEINNVLRQKGWAGAALWYNKVAELNGAMTQAVVSSPSISRWPDLMEYVREKKRQMDQNVPNNQRFNPQLANGQPVPKREPYTGPFTDAMWQSFSFWQEAGFATTSHTEPTGNIIYDVINTLFGTDGLYSMRRNADVHPLAQLTGVGRSLMESAIRNLGFATATGAAGALFSTFENFVGAASSSVASFLLSICMITMSAGFVLYYIVPFLPFIYFFFAVGGWLKAIFEAMVGLPLWALAHIRIDGNGLAGPAAVNGYFLIFEIFLRPILIIFGLLASISIFGALVYALNQVWDLVTSNMSGFDVSGEVQGIGASIGQFFRSQLDEFFFTVIYAIIVYMMALSSFKLIDLIPANILRWIGQSVATENDARENAAETLVSTSTIGGNQAIQALGGEAKKILGPKGG